MTENSLFISRHNGIVHTVIVSKVVFVLMLYLGDTYSLLGV